MDAANVDVAVTGAVAMVPSTWVPESALTPLPAGSTLNVLLNEDGIEITPTSSTSSINSWQLGRVREVITEAYVDYVQTAIENIKEIRELYFGSDESSDGVINWDPTKRRKGSFVFDGIDDADANSIKVQRHWVKNGEVLEVQPLTFNGSTPLSYGFTIRAWRGKDGTCARIFNTIGDVTDPVDPVDPPVEGGNIVVRGNHLSDDSMNDLGDTTIEYNPATGTVTITADDSMLNGTGFAVIGINGNAGSTELQESVQYTNGVAVIESNLEGGYEIVNVTLTINM